MGRKQSKRRVKLGMENGGKIEFKRKLMERERRRRNGERKEKKELRDN